MSKSIDQLTAIEADWYASQGGDYYEVGPCATREEAVDEGRRLFGGKAFVVARCAVENVRMATMFDVDTFEDDIEERAAGDFTYEGEPSPFFDLTKDQKADLQARVRDALDEWQVEHGLTFRATRFLSVADLEDVAADDADAEGAA